MANAIYNTFKGNVGVINWADNDGTTIKVMLVDNTYVLDIDTHVNKSDIDALAVEVSGTGYTAGGQTLANRLITVDTTANVGKYKCNDVTWSTSTITAHGAIIYLDTGTATTSTLIAYVDFGADKSSSAGDFVIQWSGDGVYNIG